MKTKDVELPSGMKATIRRIGPAARAKLHAMEPRIPPGLARFGIRNADQLKEAKVKDLLEDDRVGDSMIAEILSWYRESQDRQADQSIFGVCACTVEPDITPETIDDILDSDDFAALSREIDAFASEVADVVRPFSKTTSVP